MGQEWAGAALGMEGRAFTGGEGQEQKGSQPGQGGIGLSGGH